MPTRLVPLLPFRPSLQITVVVLATLPLLHRVPFTLVWQPLPLPLPLLLVLVLLLNRDMGICLKLSGESSRKNVDPFPSASPPVTWYSFLRPPRAAPPASLSPFPSLGSMDGDGDGCVGVPIATPIWLRRVVDSVGDVVSLPSASHVRSGSWMGARWLWLLWWWWC